MDTRLGLVGPYRLLAPAWAPQWACGSSRVARWVFGGPGRVVWTVWRVLDGSVLGVGVGAILRFRASPRSLAKPSAVSRGSGPRAEHERLAFVCAAQDIPPRPLGAQPSGYVPDGISGSQRGPVVSRKARFALRKPLFAWGFVWFALFF